jgi:hypothetical protein
MSTSIRYGSGHYAPQWDVLVRYCTAPYVHRNALMHELFLFCCLQSDVFLSLHS